ncbi:TetR/AcrR family transcriptional regulator [Micropruina sonneratiae]|uniref:TetR/AcrR family transcriptional regulator n=1 Tax=Micropruina sonneratiae TaxID=2986940 RepID=UPI002227678C|nr:TetR/AcrR family transcriptional regulator [Micropruina sp. KQZ13P-5]MCW3157993.1 TetR/AcrR family transcriptional regulator [Micropruina sp. KQZ13P-5]MCW3158585.1 TetR/AcrR family transcriptional regulator [Micropruina sp. KQZ13P-5]
MEGTAVKKPVRGRGRPPLSVDALQSRSQRILDAAADLVLEHGYDAISMDHIARAVDLSKGTLYEHWSTREELFLDLVHREQDSLATQVSDAAPRTVQALIRESARALLERPLLVAVLVENSAIWGKQLKRLPPSIIYQDRIASFADFLYDLRERGEIRTDQSTSEQIHIVTGVLAGFLMTRSLIPPAHSVDDDTLAQLMADTVARALEATTNNLPEPTATRLLNAGKKARGRSRT